MSDRNLRLQNILSNSPQAEGDIRKYALESFAKEIDYYNQNELMKKLILDHSAAAKRLEGLNKELQQRQAMLLEAQKIAKLGRWDVERDSGKAVWSKSLYDVMELDPDSPASPELFLSRVHPDDRENIGQLYLEMFSKTDPWAIRYRLLMEDGRIKWVYLRLNPSFDSKRRIDGYFGTIQDITEMKKIEEKLEKYSQHLEHLVEDKVREISASQMATIYALIKLSESRDDDTGAHIERTAGFCRMLAERARFSPEYAEEIDDTFIETIFKASPLHDIGKVGIPDSILMKPGKLTDNEFEIMKTHVQIGYDTIAKVAQQYDGNEFLAMGMDIALYHHEKWNGSGYNKGLKRGDIPLSARIMAISDVYDALRSKRVYKPAYSHSKSMEIIISGRDGHFDPTLVDIFIRHEDELKSLFESIK